MIVKGKNIGRTNGAISINSKVFANLINDIENSDLMAMDSIDLLTIINKGILPNNAVIKNIMITDPFSDERKNSIEKIKVAIENGEDVTTSTLSEDEIPEDIEDNNSDDVIITNTLTEKKENKKLAKLNLMKNLKSIDSSLVNAIGDEEAIDDTGDDAAHGEGGGSGRCGLYQLLAVPEFLQPCSGRAFGHVRHKRSLPHGDARF